MSDKQIPHPLVAIIPVVVLIVFLAIVITLFGSDSLNGGHNIPEEIVRRRYVAGISNLFRIFIPEVDFWNIYDNSQKPRIQIALGGREADTIVFNNTLYQELQNYVK